jgi:hypothetical protein
MEIKKLQTIPEPKENTRSVMQLTADNPLFIGEGDTTFVCGECEKILLKNMPAPLNVRNIVIRCYTCGKFNNVP